MRLIELIGENAYRAARQAGGFPPDPDGGPDIGALTADSRTVRPGALYAALPGSLHDGRDFIGAAVAADDGVEAPAEGVFQKRGDGFERRAGGEARRTGEP